MCIHWDSPSQCYLTRAAVAFCFRDPTARRTAPGTLSTMHLPVLLPTISIKTSPTYTSPVLLRASNLQIRSPSLDSLYVVSFTHYIFLPILLFFNRRTIRPLVPLHSTVTA